jgi:hypothetical protein
MVIVVAVLPPPPVLLVLLLSPWPAVATAGLQSPSNHLLPRVHPRLKQQ